MTNPASRSDRLKEATDAAEARLERIGTLPFLNTSVPNAARIYDYLLGGKNHFAADREAGEELKRLLPDAVTACRQNREFLARAVRFLAGEAGIRQFVDIGTGLPTQGNVHEIAQDVAPDARVLYVDYDPVVVSHAQALLATSPHVIAINGDLRSPAEILGHPASWALINPDEPVAILLVAILHFIADNEEPYGGVDMLKAAMPPGSYLVLSHITADEIPDEASRKAREVYESATAPAIPRSREQVERFFAGLDVVEPGIVDVSRWRNETQPFGPGRTLMYSGVGRKP